ncbi:amidase family protein [Conexibacter sp. JD483]|uniref:amidase n=1 Tax=unclassified Conexibacter TaxID=2627773 RepID=UPI0027229C55|nr:MULTISPECIES: amidase family protein [unclassified Conexibacter]MDO8187374.1 amidase family protein [Conexibacter sp. CPCC 205706]MDO8200969.1 amidase family protein [Conexibacter sp. CPCC 205762]MDR9371409.1 amidase family protein [Conexibacter sp. JD483]
MQDYARAGGTPARSRRRSRAAAAALGGAAAVALLGAGQAQAINYVPASNGAVWGVHDAAAPGLDTGSIRDVRNSSALIGFGGIRVRLAGSEPRFNGELMRGFGLRYDGYEDFASTSAADLGGVSISRAIHVERSATWIRYVDTFTNTTGGSKTIEVAFGGQTGYAQTSASANGSSSAANQSSVVATSSGDTALTPADSWSIVASPQAAASNASFNGPAGVVIGSPAPFAGAMTAATNFFTTPFDGSLITSGHLANYQGYLNKLTLRAGETRSLVHFVAVGLRETAGTTGQQVDAVRTVLSGLAANPVLDDLPVGTLCTIANFNLAALTIPGFLASDCTGVAYSQVPTGGGPARTPTTSSPYDVTGKTLSELQADMEAGVTTSAEITRAYLDRVAAYDVGPFGFHSLITVAPDAMEQARAADTARAQGRSGELLGIPVAVKDLYDTKDMPTTGGSLVFDGFRPVHDSFQVAKLRAAGAIIFAKANLSEYANSGFFSESGYGQVWNAFEPSKSSIGSSGGSAVAVAASLAAVALGSQTGDSLWGPSSGSSLYSLRGTDGLASTSGVMPLTWGQDFAGTIARSVPDLAAMLDVTTGTDPADEWTVEADADARRPADWHASLDANALSGKTIGYYADAFPAGFGIAATRDAMVASFACFRTAGATVKEIPAPPAAPSSVPGDRGYEGWARWVDAHPESEYDDAVQIIESQRRLAYSRSSGYRGTGRMTASEVAGWKAYRAEYKARLARWMDDNGVDAVVYPGLLSDIGLNDTVTPSFARIDPQSSASGVPSVIFPAGKNDHDEPFNLQLMGRAWDDAKLIGFAYAYDLVQHGHQETSEAPPLRYDPSVTPRPIVIERLVPSQTTPPAPDPNTNVPLPATPAPTTPAARRVAIKVAVAKKASVRGGKVRFVLRNASSAKLTGTVTLRAKVGKKTVVLGSGKVSLAAGKRGTLTVTLSRAARRALGGRAKVTATATYALRNATGAKTTRKAALTIALK